MWPHVLTNCIFLSLFFNSITLLFARFYVMLTFFLLSFFLVLKMPLRILYLVNLTVMGRGTLLSSLRFPKRCVLWISWIVISSLISFFIMLMIAWFVYSFFFSSTPRTRRQFLLECCFWRSKVLPNSWNFF